jgi:phospholipid/cholesterol/gamma-HCH transport system substrate-binding protein
MISLATKARLMLFVLITLAGLSYVSANYVGLFNGLFGPSGCTVHADFPDSGGIFADAEVTYRGVGVGRVGALHLTDRGVRVDLRIRDCAGAEIPADSAASVSDRSVIGEQYVDLTPPNDKGPYFRGGEVIPMRRTSIPVSPQELLSNIDALVTSVDTAKLRTVVDELGAAFNQRGPDLGHLLDSTHDLLSAAQQNLPATVALIEQSATVLQTQLDEKDPLRSWAHSLNLLSRQLKASDPDIRTLLDHGPSDLGVVEKFVQDNRTDLGVTLGNLATVGTLLVRHLDGIEEVLEVYPVIAAGGQTVIQPDSVGALGMVLNVNDPKDCGDPAKGSEGYGGTRLRSPSDLSPSAPNVAAHCTASVSSGTDVRGSANVPGGDPVSASGGAVYRSATTQRIPMVGTSLDKAGALGDDAWLAMLGAGLQ